MGILQVQLAPWMTDKLVSHPTLSCLALAAHLEHGRAAQQLLPLLIGPEDGCQRGLWQRP